jgi:hypothetical protein
MKRTAAIAAAIALATAGLAAFAPGVAGADPSLSLSQSTGLVHNQQIDITVSGIVPGTESDVTISQCANAYANLTPLPSIDDAYGSRDCEVLEFANGILSTSITFTNVPIKQHGIGAGNRACINSGGPASCFIHISQSVNQGGSRPSVDISFVADVPGTPAGTVTTVELVGSPLAVGKTAYAHVTVHRVDNGPVPEGTFDVSLDGGTPVTLPVDADGDAIVQIAAPNTLSIGPHTLNATYNGNGSFNSSSDSDAVSIVSDFNITIGDASVVGGTVNVTGKERKVIVPVVLSRPTSVPLTVFYAFSGGSAVEGVDYNPVTVPMRKVKWNANGPTVKYIVVKTLSNPGAGDKTLNITLQPITVPNPDGFVFRRATGTATIRNISGSSPLTVNVGDGMVPEGDLGGAKSVKFAITLSQPAAQTVIVRLAVGNETAIKKPRTQGGDWGGGSFKKVKINAGEVSRLVTVPTMPDVGLPPSGYGLTQSGTELTETFTIDVCDVYDAATPTPPTLLTPCSPTPLIAIGDGRGIGTILTDE